jgi:hypothetical protein
MRNFIEGVKLLNPQPSIFVFHCQYWYFDIFLSISIIVDVAAQKQHVLFYHLERKNFQVVWFVDYYYILFFLGLLFEWWICGMGSPL